jgi:hypothetical protein
LAERRVKGETNAAAPNLRGKLHGQRQHVAKRSPCALWTLETPAACLGNSGDDLLVDGSLLANATDFVAQELLIVVQIAKGSTTLLVTSQNSSHTARGRARS